MMKTAMGRKEQHNTKQATGLTSEYILRMVSIFWNEDLLVDAGILLAGSFFPNLTRRP